MQTASAAMVRAVLQECTPKKEQIINAHGVCNKFLSNYSNVSQVNQTYYIRKALWAKGFDKMLEL